MILIPEKRQDDLTVVRFFSPLTILSRKCATKESARLSHIIASVAEFDTFVVPVDSSLLTMSSSVSNVLASELHFFRILVMFPFMSILTGAKAFDPSLSKIGRRSAEFEISKQV